MDTGLLIQYLIIAVAVLVSVWVVLKKQFPGTVRKLRGVLALALLKPGRAAWLQALGRRIAPPATGGGGACGSTAPGGPAPPPAPAIGRVAPTNCWAPHPGG